ncbi:MAG: hypothetical protein JRH20_13045, partial [Deltaproteobacteria bacterium]|nr:hypothetical protein [Deltaproteobacteria bacterium]
MDKSIDTGPTTPQDSTIDAPPDDELLLVLRTTSERPEAFNPKITKTGAPLRWELDLPSDPTFGNTIDVVYLAGSGEKTVRIFSSDGAAGITVLESTGDFLQGSI